MAVDVAESLDLPPDEQAMRESVDALNREQLRESRLMFQAIFEMGSPIAVDSFEDAQTDVLRFLRELVHALHRQKPFHGDYHSRGVVGGGSAAIARAILKVDPSLALRSAGYNARDGSHVKNVEAIVKTAQLIGQAHDVSLRRLRAEAPLDFRVKGFLNLPPMPPMFPSPLTHSLDNLANGEKGMADAYRDIAHSNAPYVRGNELESGGLLMARLRRYAYADGTPVFDVSEGAIRDLFDDMRVNAESKTISHDPYATPIGDDIGRETLRAVGGTYTDGQMDKEVPAIDGENPVVTVQTKDGPQEINVLERFHRGLRLFQPAAHAEDAQEDATVLTFAVPHADLNLIFGAVENWEGSKEMGRRELVELFDPSLRPARSRIQQALRGEGTMAPGEIRALAIQILDWYAGQPVVLRHRWALYQESVKTNAMIASSPNADEIRAALHGMFRYWQQNRDALIQYHVRMEERYGSLRTAQQADHETVRHLAQLFEEEVYAGIDHAAIDALTEFLRETAQIDI